jgi:hypothetical protein
MQHSELGQGQSIGERAARKASRRFAPMAWVLGALVSTGCGAGSSDSTQATLALFPDEAFVIAGPEGGPFFPESKTYLLSNSGGEPLQWSARTSHPSIIIVPSAGTLEAGESVIATTLVDVVGGLPPGQYVAQMTFVNETTGSEQEQSALLVISGSGTLVVSPSIGFSSSGPVGGPFAPLSQGYVITNDSEGTIDWAIESSAPWLAPDIAFGQLASAASQGVVLAIDPAQAGQLAAATHVANVLFRDLTNGVDFTVLVELEVVEPAALAISPAGGFTTSGPPSGPFSPAEKSYTLTNLGSELLSWQISRNASWVTLSRTTGNLGPGQQTSVTVGIDASVTGSMADGSYAASVSFTNTTNGLGNTTRPVDLDLTSPPALLGVSPAQPFASSGPAGGPFLPATKAYTLTNGGGLTLNWQATASAAWLVLAPASGSLAPGASAQVVASIHAGVAAGLPVGQHSAQLAFVNLTNGAGNANLGGSLNISSSGGSVPVLTPGGGFTGSTQEPGQIGSGTAKAIARWDVVPYQTITAADDPTFTVGVVAFHIAGIARVSFGLEGGPFVDATAMTLNPETGVWEYCATLDARDFATDRPIELRAIAYPNAAAPQAEGTGGYPGGGFPRLLDSLRLYVDAGPAEPPLVRYCSPSGSDSSGDGSAGNPYASPWRAAQAIHSAGGGSADGGIVYLEAGNYDWGQPGGGGVPQTVDRWLTFRSRPGLTRDQVKIVSGAYPGMTIDRIRVHEVTLNHYIHGDDGGHGGSDEIWLDGVTCTGRGIGTAVHPFGGWTPGFRSKYWTDVRVTDNAASVPESADILRDVHCQRNQYGPIKPKLVVNCSWDTMNNGGTSNHPDFTGWNFAGQGTTFDNSVVYGLTASNIDAQGIFYKDTGHLNNVAFVNVALGLLGAGGSPIGTNCLGIDHFLMINFTHLGPSLHWDMPQSQMKHISIRGNHFDRMAIGGSGDSINGSWFDNNNYGVGFGAISPGSNASRLDPMFVSPFTPGGNSPLRGRLPQPMVPADCLGALRTSPSTLGAVE